MKLFNRLRKDKRGVTGLVIATVIALIVITAIVPIGIVITYNIKLSIDAMSLPANSAAANASTAVFNNSWAAYNLSSIMSIVAAAGAIITIIVASFAYMGSRRQQ